MPEVTDNEESDFQDFTETIECLSETELRIILGFYVIDLDEHLEKMWHRIAHTLWPEYRKG